MVFLVSWSVLWNLFPEVSQQTEHVQQIFIVNFEHISHYFLVFILLTLNRYIFTGF